MYRKRSPNFYRQVQENIERYSLDLFDESGVNYYGEFTIKIGDETIIIMPPRDGGTIHIKKGYLPYYNLEDALEKGSERLRKFLIFNFDLLQEYQEQND